MTHKMMTLISPAVFLTFLIVCEEKIDTAPPLPEINMEDWAPVWNDEFDGDAIDDQKWNKLHGGPIG